MMDDLGEMSLQERHMRLWGDLDNARVTIARLTAERDQARALQDRAWADYGVLWEAMDDALLLVGVPAAIWDADHSARLKRANAIHDADCPGAPLLALLDAARAWKQAIETTDGVAAAEAALMAAVEACE